jgi:hypothetical protein
MANNTFQQVGSARVPRSVHDLSHQKLLSMDMGWLVPCMNLFCMPGDVFDIGHELVIRFQPMVAPILHEVHAYVQTYFVPIRLIDSNFEDFATGGADGTAAPAVSTWDPADKTVGSLWDYLGFPTGVAMTGFLPVDWPAKAYNLVYNEFYRDQTHISEVSLTQDQILIRAWEKDYFTSALPWQQRGTAPALPISGIIDVDPTSAGIPTPTGHTANDATERDVLVTGSADLQLQAYAASAADFRWTDPALEVDMAGASTFDVSDLRLAFQQQKILERNARAGGRYVEWLKSHYGRSPTDARLDRPEYVGGMRSPVIVSEVLQTESSDATTPLGELGGHGITVDAGRAGRYRCEEFGVMISLLSVMPRTIYSQGVDAQWRYTDRWDLPMPELAGLSEQPVYRGEIYGSGVSSENNTVFGYQGRFNQFRYQQSGFAGDMRSTFDYWHIGRQFTSAPALNQTFLECVPRKDHFAVAGEDGLIVSVGNRVRAVRPIPVASEPGFIDH